MRGQTNRVDAGGVEGLHVFWILILGYDLFMMVIVTYIKLGFYSIF